MAKPKKTLEERIEVLEKQVAEIKALMNGGNFQQADSGGSNPPGPGQPGHP